MPSSISLSTTTYTNGYSTSINTETTIGGFHTCDSMVTPPQYINPTIPDSDALSNNNPVSPISSQPLEPELSDTTQELQTAAFSSPLQYYTPLYAVNDTVAPNTTLGSSTCTFDNSSQSYLSFDSNTTQIAYSSAYHPSNKPPINNTCTNPQDSGDATNPTEHQDNNNQATSKQHTTTNHHNSDQQDGNNDENEDKDSREKQVQPSTHPSSPLSEPFEVVVTDVPTNAVSHNNKYISWYTTSLSTSRLIYWAEHDIDKLKWFCVHCKQFQVPHESMPLTVLTNLPV